VAGSPAEKRHTHATHLRINIPNSGNMSETSEASSYDYDGGGGTTSNAIIPSPVGQPSPGQKLLSSMVLGDGSFEASMKERSRVSF
jgi:hypothetical protein